MASATCWCCYPTVDGLYDAPPHLNTKQAHSLVPRISAEIESDGGEAASDHAAAACRTKIEAANRHHRRHPHW